MGLIAAVLIGTTALGVDVGFAIYKHRQMQSASDAAAFGAAKALATGHPANFRTEAYADAAAVGFVNGANGVVVTVNQPPTSGNHTTDPTAVQVVITQPQTLSLVGAVKSFYGGSNPSGLFTLGVSAVVTPGAGGGCAWQLTTSANPGVTISNGATVTLVSCGLQVCATGSTALRMSGATQLNLKDKSGNFSSSNPVSVAGSASITNGATINGVANTCKSPTCKTSQACGADPYAGVTMPTLGGCSNGTGKSYGHSNSGLQTINPGVWCSGVSFTNDANVLLTPGVYYVNKGNFNVGGNVIMNGTGITIVLTGGSGNYATVTIGNGAHVTLTAPTTGATQGIVFFGDRNAPTSTSSNFGGGANMNITGAIYLPTQKVTFTNGIANPSGCTQLIAGTMTFSGGADFSNNCAGVGTSGSGGALALVE